MSALELGAAFVVGMSIALTPHFLATQFFLQSKVQEPHAILRRFYVAVFVKWLTTLLLFALVFCCFSFEPSVLLIGFVVAQGLFLKIVNKTNNSSSS